MLSKGNPMYPAIFKTDETVDSQALLGEFLAWEHGGLNPIYGGNNGWTGVCVYAKGGVNRIAELPRLKSLVDRIGADQVVGVNYFNLEPRADLHRHRDMYGNLLFGVSRIHIPIKTNPGAIMEVERRPYHLGLNEMWCLDTSGLHALWNHSDENRIHVVIDVKRGPSTLKYFPAWSAAVAGHLAYFVLVMSGKVARDLLMRPGSILRRLKGMSRQIGLKI